MNLVNLESVRKAYGAAPLLDRVALGVDEGARVGIVGRNGSGKTTLAAVVAGAVDPDEGRVTHTRGLRVGYLPQQDTTETSSTVRELLLPGLAEHEWAGNTRVREVLHGLFGGLDLPLLPGGWEADAATLSGGERRRLALARLLVGEHDAFVLDEPTNHLDIEAIDWLARHLDSRGCALAVVTHDRYFLDSVCNRIWEVERGQVHRYEGGYSDYILARAERERLAAAAEQRRRNLLRKELAWLRRGPPARTSKPKFRVEAANALVTDEPPPRDTVELTRFATARLGKTVLQLQDVTLSADPAGQVTLLDRATWQLGPGDRVGVVGANGCGKTSLLRLLAGELVPTHGRLVRGKTVQAGCLSQDVSELDSRERVLEAVRAVRSAARVADRELSASQLAERFGFTGDRQWAPIEKLSGGERRRLQLLRLLMAEPNVLLLDEPTNDLDIDTLNELEDLLDGWPGSLVVVSHDRYFLQRVTDYVVALLGDGKVSLLPGGVDEYLARPRHRQSSGSAGGGSARQPRPDRDPQRTARGPGRSAARAHTTRKELARLERRLDRLAEQEARLHEQLAAHAADYEKAGELGSELRELTAEREQVEHAWLELAEQTG